MDNWLTANSSFVFNYYFINTILNPQNADYLGSYFEDRNYFAFTKKLGSSANLFISTYEIATDNSLLPQKDVNTELGGIVYENTQIFIYQPVNEYIQLQLRKSSLSLLITRSFKKAD